MTLRSQKSMLPEVWVVVAMALSIARPTLAATWPAAARLDSVIGQAIDDGTIPGAVLLVGHRGEILHHKAYGSRSLEPTREPMELDSIFDCASLTKVVVTTTAIMMLVEEGKVRLGDRVTEYLPEFSRGDSPITVRQLLTHYSGLRPDVDLEPPWSGYETGMEKAYQEIPIAEPGERFIYSDINYLLLGEIVHRLTEKPLDEFAREKIFRPLGMGETRFRPPAELRSRIAPTERLPDGTLLHGVVHDPTTRFMEGIAGHAGMFSTAKDLSRFAQMMLNGGKLGETRILSPLSVFQMSTPQSPSREAAALRGLGWDIDSPYSSVRGDLFPIGSYGHSGYTGTSIWIDPLTQTYVVLLTNRVHPEVKTSVVGLRSRVASVVAASFEDVNTEPLRWAAAQVAAWGAAAIGADKPFRPAQVFTGLDVLARKGFAPFAGKRVGLITNHTGIDRHRRRNIDLLAAAAGVTLKAIFAPEHGIDGRHERDDIADGRDAATGIPVYSLYRQERRRPTPEMLAGIDVLVYDIQDVGARFYTYTTTMAYAMEEAAKLGIPVYVLDRPNPITGTAVEGPMLEESYRSFVGYFPMPVRHGMTIGELAAMFNEERKIGTDLKVISMEGWKRDLWFDETGLAWVDPSPNIRTLEQALLYPGIALLEGLQNYSVGRGTDTPFLFLGADWIDASKLAHHLNSLALAGVRFYALQRTPRSSHFAGKTIDGVQITVVDRNVIEPTRIGIEIAAALMRFYSSRVNFEETARLIGNQATLESLKEGGRPSSVWKQWRTETAGFLRARASYLLY